MQATAIFEIGRVFFAGARLSLLCLVFSALFSVGFSQERPGYLSAPDVGDLSDIYRSAVYLDHAELDHLSEYFFSEGVALAGSMPPSDAKSRLYAGAIVFFSQDSKTAEAKPLLDELNAPRMPKETVETQVLWHVAQGAFLLASFHAGPALDFGLQSLALAHQVQDPAYAIPPLLLIARSQVALNKPALGLEQANQALGICKEHSLYPLLPEVYLVLSECQRALGNEAASRINQRLRYTANMNLSEAPILDFQHTSGMVREYRAQHGALAEMGRYGEARNVLASLLCLTRFQFNLREEMVKHEREELSRPLFLAYMSLYAQFAQEEYPAYYYLQLAYGVLPNELDPENRAWFYVVAARYNRLVGDPNSALIQLEQSKRNLQRAPAAGPDLQMQIFEQTGMALLQMGRYAQAVPLLEQARESALARGQEVRASRLTFFLEVHEKGERLAPAVLRGQPEEVVSAMLKYERGMRARGAEGRFRSPFVADYVGGGAAPAAAAVLAQNPDRPSPPRTAALDARPYIRTKKWGRAIEILKKIIERDGASEDLLMQLGEAYYATSQWGEARDAFLKVLEINPDNGRASEYLKTVRFRLERRKSAP